MFLALLLSICISSSVSRLSTLVMLLEGFDWLSARIRSYKVGSFDCSGSRRFLFPPAGFLLMGGAGGGAFLLPFLAVFRLGAGTLLLGNLKATHNPELRLFLDAGSSPSE